MKQKQKKRRLTTSVCHAVEKEPGAGPGAIFEEAHVVAGLNAEHGEQFHHAPGNGTVGRYCQHLGGVTLTGGMSVHLRKQQRFYRLLLGLVDLEWWPWASTCELQVEQYCLILPGCSLRSGKHWRHSCSADCPQMKHSRWAGGHTHPESN